MPPATTEALPETAPLTYRGVVYPWQCDHIGHMNVMWYVSKFDEAGWNLMAGIGLTASHFRAAGTGMAAVQQNISYQRELLPGDTVTIRSQILEIRDKVIRLRHEMAHGESGAAVAMCDLTCVHMDRTRRKAVPFPAEVAARARRQIAGAAP